ncbi:MAG: hypothetical protein U0992_20095 [Planctomycetaceae bacterium]
MFRFAGILFALGCIVPVASAQDYYYPQSYGGDFYGPASVGSSEPLFPYDDQDPWKHGYLQIMPFYGGHTQFLPFNYKAVFSQSQVAAGWGMPNVMPYSQQFWHRYEQRADLSQPRCSQRPILHNRVTSRRPGRRNPGMRPPRSMRPPPACRPPSRRTEHVFKLRRLRGAARRAVAQGTPALP